MRNLKTRLERAEEELRFKLWILFNGTIDGWSEEQLKAGAVGVFPDIQQVPAPGASRLDSVTRPSLVKLWRIDEEEHAGRSPEDWDFYSQHAHWPEQSCPLNCQNPDPQS